MGPALWVSLWLGEGRPEQPALRCGDVTWTFARLLDEIRRTEAAFRAHGVGPGDLVTILSLNTPETVAALYAADRVGAVADFVDMKTSPADVAGALTRSGSRVVLVLEPAFAKIYRNRGEAPAETFVVLPVGPYVPPALGDKLGAGKWRARAGGDCLSWSDFQRDPVDVPPETARWEDPAVITYTGGTTGPAKGVALSRRAIHASLAQYTASGTESGPGAEALTLLPVFSAFGLTQCIHVPLCLGMTVILVPFFRPGQLLACLKRYRPRQVNGTTSYWQLLLREQEAGDLSFLENPRCGGDVIQPGAERQINEFLAAHGCAAPLVIEYGMSEACGIVCLSWGEPRRAGTVGRPLPGCEIVAVDPDTARPLPPGEVGELLISSPTEMLGYHRQPEADGQVLRPGPGGKTWVWTGDLGYVDGDGLVTVTGRIKRMISRNGFKIFPVVIEDCILASGLAEACAVVGGQSPGGETLPVAHVVLKAGVDPVRGEAELSARAKAMLNTYLIPAAYVFHDALPLTERGKLDYRALEDRTRL